MSKASQIIKGHIKEFLNMEKDLAKKRLAICKVCPLYKETNIGPICNPNLYLNPQTMETRHSPKTGYLKGCGCRLNAKIRLQDANCPTEQW